MKFNENISFFNNIKSDPETITLFDWLEECMLENDYRNEIEAYRNEYNTLKSQGLDEADIKQMLQKEGLMKFKQNLPFVTVGAVCEGGRSMNHVARKTGWIALDVDGKDNPHLTDFEAVRDELSKIIYVAFSCLSVGGNGVWLLLKVEHPDRQEDYFQQLLHDFRERGVVLDHTKGKNPNEARFYSFDPGAKIRDDFKIYDRLPSTPQPKTKSHNPRKPVSYDGDVFEFARKVVEDKHGYTFTHPGDMHNSLFQFCAVLNWKGVPKKKAEEYIDQNILSLSKITTNCITGPYEKTEYFGEGAQDRTINLVLDRGDGPPDSQNFNNQPS